MKNKFKILIPNILLGIFLFTGCSTYREPQKYPEFTSEEAMFKFQKITDENDHIKLDFRTDIFSVSNKGDSIVYESLYEGKWNIFLRKLSSLKVRQQRTFKQNVYSPSISDDGSKIAYCKYEENSGKNIYQIGGESGGTIRQITVGSNTNFDPVYFSDNNRILFSRNEIAGYQYNSDSKTNEPIYEPYLWSYDLRNGALLQYGKGQEASFFKDQEKVVVVRFGKNGYGQLWILDLINGSETLLLSSETNTFRKPNVSPDGTKVTFTGWSKRNPHDMEIFTIRTDGTDFRQITFHYGNDSHPIWDKNSKDIYFLSERGDYEGNYSIWKVIL